MEVPKEYSIVPWELFFYITVTVLYTVGCLDVGTNGTNTENEFDGR